VGAAEGVESCGVHVQHHHACAQKVEVRQTLANRLVEDDCEERDTARREVAVPYLLHRIKGGAYRCERNTLSQAYHGTAMKLPSHSPNNNYN
jgi:hypothetical protein